jgi:hypothetical protein
MRLAFLIPVTGVFVDFDEADSSTCEENHDIMSIDMKNAVPGKLSRSVNV